MNVWVKQSEKEISVAEYLAHYVSEERFLQCCEACPNFGKRYSCPPYDFSVQEYWRQFSYLKLVLYRIEFPPETPAAEAYQTYDRVKETMGKELLAREAETPGSVSLAPGSCRLCGDTRCAREEGLPCRHQAEMRYSLESLGGDVVATLKELFDVGILWVQGDKAPAYLTLVGGILQK